MAVTCGMLLPRYQGWAVAVSLLQHPAEMGQRQRATARVEAMKIQDDGGIQGENQVG